MTDIAAIISGQLPYTRVNEGCRLEAYRDSLGNWTIGVGHLGAHEGEVWTQEQADAQLQTDLDSTADGLTTAAPWWVNLDVVRAGVFLDMAFNLGVHKFSTWKHTLGYAYNGDYAECGDEIEGSQPWASQVGNRAVRNANQMRTGVYQSEPATA